jgi:hypothetical protein
MSDAQFSNPTDQSSDTFWVALGLEMLWTDIAGRYRPFVSKE